MLLYRILSVLLLPAIEIYLLFRVVKKKEDKFRLKERLSNITIRRPEGDIVWLHAVSVGEANSALILVDTLLKTQPQIKILFTSTTLTSAAIIAAKIPNFNGRVIHQFLPVDSYYCVQKFFDFWQVKVAIFVESEIWPNLISVAHEREIKTFLVNARMSEKSFHKWRIARILGFKIFDYFAAIFAQTKEDKERLAQLTKQEIFLYGNLKAQAENLAFDAVEFARLKSEIGMRKFWLAASTHKGEEEIIIQAHQLLKKDFPDLLTIIVPRHPTRADEIKQLLAAISFAQRSCKQKIESSTEIYLADSLGELGIFYRFAPFAFIGGSLAEVGGHNPFEAIKLGCAIISGRKLFNFKEIYEKLEAQKACALVDSAQQLSEKVREFLQEENARKGMADKALEVVGNSENIAEKIAAEIDRALKEVTT